MASRSLLNVVSFKTGWLGFARICTAPTISVASIAQRAKAVAAPPLEPFSRTSSSVLCPSHTVSTFPQPARRLESTPAGAGACSSRRPGQACRPRPDSLPRCTTGRRPRSRSSTMLIAAGSRNAQTPQPAQRCRSATSSMLRMPRTDWNSALIGPPLIADQCEREHP